MELRLFHKWSCPYSAKVRDFIEENGLREQVEYLDREEANNEEKLKDLAGKTQVPCLVVNGQPIHESDEIISWLEENCSSSSEARA
jgi:glutaredoxin